MKDTLRAIGESFSRRHDEVMKPVEEGKRMPKKKRDNLCLRGSILMDFALVFVTAACRLEKEE